MMASSGAISLGFSTIVQPAASAGATLQVIWLSGQFQGVIMPTTPIGSLTTSEPSLDALEFKSLEGADHLLEMRKADSDLLLEREIPRRAHFPRDGESEIAGACLVDLHDPPQEREPGFPGW